MRQVLSLSLPRQVGREVKILAERRGFASVSGYFKYLIDSDRDLIGEAELLKSIKAARKEYKSGKMATAKSMAALL